MKRVVHFEIPVDDPTRAARFYENVFGWRFQKWEGPMEYWMVSTGQEAPGIDGGMLRRQQPGQGVNHVIDVASVDETTAVVEQAGGRTVVPKSPIPGVGYVAYYLDPENNMFGVMQADESAG